MKYFSPRMLPELVNALWDARALGLPPEHIAARIGWSTTAVRVHVRDHAGVRPRVSTPKRSLSFEERIEIQALRRAGAGVRAIARELGRSPSTISRELASKSNSRRYIATRAQAITWEKARRPRPSKLATSPRLRAVVQDWLDQKYSPEQVAGRLAREFPTDPEMRVSHETIYQAIYLISRGGLQREVKTRLRTGRAVRYPTTKRDERRGRIPGMTMIAERPAEADDRSIPGHWEGDLIVGKDSKSAIGTVVERHSGYVLLIWLDPDVNRVDALTQGLTAKLAALPDTLRHTLTWDQGREMNQHVKIAVNANIDIYFCDPHSPWQRPSNENTNGLLRQYFPKGTDLSIHSQADLDYVQWEMNDRPRKRLEFAKPNEVIEKVLLR